MSFAVQKNCYATMWSYGMICVGCGCCKRGAYKERLEYQKEQLEADLNFDRWSDDEGLRKLQEKNRLSNIKYEERKIKQLKKQIKAKKVK